MATIKRLQGNTVTTICKPTPKDDGHKRIVHCDQCGQGAEYQRTLIGIDDRTLRYCSYGCRDLAEGRNY